MYLSDRNLTIKKKKKKTRKRLSEEYEVIVSIYWSGHMLVM